MTKEVAHILPQCNVKTIWHVLILFPLHQYFHSSFFYLFILKVRNNANCSHDSLFLQMLMTCTTIGCLKRNLPIHVFKFCNVCLCVYEPGHICLVFCMWLLCNTYYIYIFCSPFLRSKQKLKYCSFAQFCKNFNRGCYIFSAGSYPQEQFILFLSGQIIYFVRDNTPR
jgi:hypothetical protein